MQDETKQEKVNSLCIPFYTAVSVLFHHSTKFQLDIRGATQNFREFARNNMNAYFKS